ncbi:MAG: hypothetical protein ACRYF5_04285, partial [Janthinobacterium lividum]
GAFPYRALHDVYFPRQAAARAAKQGAARRPVLHIEIVIRVGNTCHHETVCKFGWHIDRTKTDTAVGVGEGRLERQRQTLPLL